MWTKPQIRQARKIELAPLLSRRGFRLRPLQNGNILIEDHPNLVIKQHYWTWPDKNMAGNTIDFFVKVEGLSFHQAMQIISNEHSCGQNMANQIVSSGMTTTRTGTKDDRSAGIAQN